MRCSRFRLGTHPVALASLAISVDTDDSARDTDSQSVVLPQSVEVFFAARGAKCRRVEKPSDDATT